MLQDELFKIADINFDNDIQDASVGNAWSGPLYVLYLCVCAYS